MTAEVQTNGSIEEVVLKSTQQLKKEANRITKRKTLYAAGAGLVPFPILDAALLLGIQLTMIKSIAKVYDVEFKENLVKSIIGSLVGSLGAVGLTKVIPGVGTLVGSVTAAVTGAAATYALGKVFTQHFDQGGTLLDFDPVKSREFFEKEFEAGRLFVSDAAAVEEGVEKEKKGILSNLFTNEKKQQQKEQEAAERLELLETNKALVAAIASLKEEVAALKQA